MRKKTNSDLLFDGFVKEVAGAHGLKVVHNIGDAGSTDEVIERASGLKLAQIRSILNQLNYHGIVEYTREKNMQSGWFTYTWKVNRSRALQNFLVRKKNEYAQLRTQSSGQGDAASIYACPKGCETHLFEKAVDCGFECTRCKSKLRFSEGSERLNDLENKINTLEAILRAPAVI